MESSTKDVFLLLKFDIRIFAWDQRLTAHKLPVLPFMCSRKQRQIYIASADKPFVCARYILPAPTSNCQRRQAIASADKQLSALNTQSLRTAAALVAPNASRLRLQRQIHLHLFTLITTSIFSQWDCVSQNEWTFYYKKAVYKKCSA